MSDTLLSFAESFLDERIDVEHFVNSFQELWKIERDNKTLLEDKPDLQELLSSIFCAADMYSPDFDRTEYEIDELELRKEILELINNYRDVVSKT